jgi:catechol 2,3-dioxygenase-like lactoylglutathione lyase family enzyme
VSDFIGIDHVQLAAPPGCEPAARAFFVGLLGLVELDKPEVMKARGGCWFACGAQQIHVGVEATFTPALKAHPAIRVRDLAALERLAAHLSDNGVTVVFTEEIPSQRRFHAADPWGNRLEFVTDI